MSGLGARSVGPRLAAVKAHAGLAFAVVPFAVVTHLIAEGFAIDAAADLPVFFLRHLYLVAPLVCSLLFFGVTIGIGLPKGEVRRRCALMRARMRELRHIGNGVSFVSLNLAFFGITQLLEGMPIEAGSIPIAVVCALLGAISAAFMFFFFGAAVGSAVLEIVIRTLCGVPANRLIERAFIAPGRTATALFSLFIPNRPPPQPSFF